MNRWMNDPRYLAQIGHTLGGYAIVLTAFLFFGRPSLLFSLPAIVVAAALKEFWYDARYELPKQTAFDNWLDFGFYLVGAGLGSAACLLRL